MPKNKKRFIDKKTATTYTLVSRSLQPIGEGQILDETSQRPQTSEHRLARKEEEQKYGIYFNDDYDYLRHLRDVAEVAGSWEAQSTFRVGRPATDVLLESLSVVSGYTGNSQTGHAQRPESYKSAFSSRPGLAADFLGFERVPKAAAADEEDEVSPDPDILEAMQEEFEFDNPENLLDDDFLVQAKGGLTTEEFDDYPGIEEHDEYVDPTRSMHKGNMVGAWVEHQDPDVELEETATSVRGSSTVELIKQWVTSHNKEEPMEEVVGEDRRSRFSNSNSMTSSVMRRTAELRLLDDRFERMFEQDYDEEEIGGLDLDDHEGRSGGVDDYVLLNLIAEKTKKDNFVEALISEDPLEPDEVAMRFQFEDEAEGKLEKIVLEEDDDKFDCQSILSHRSSRSYQPKVLDVPRKPKPVRLQAKTGIPLDEFNARKKFGSSDEDTESEEEDDVLSQISSLSVPRPKNETPAERKLRKQTLKELRRERRVEKKMSKVAFKEEKIRQEKEVANIQRRLKTVVMV